MFPAMMYRFDSALNDQGTIKPVYAVNKHIIDLYDAFFFFWEKTPLVTYVYQLISQTVDMQ